MEEPRQNRTEKPTSRRLQKSREQGNVPRSQELPPALALGGLLLFAKVFGGDFLRTAEGLIRGTLSDLTPGLGDPALLTAALRSSLWAGLALGAPLIGCMALASAAGQFAQGGFVFTGEGLKPNLAKLDPVKNLQGLFSLKRLVTLLRTILKLGLVVWVVKATVTPEIPALLALTGHGPREIFALTIALSGRLIWKFTLFAVALALFDYLYQKFEHTRDLKMSKQEVKEEQRDLEGDPLVRGRQRARQQALARRRMMADIPRADVVVTNPTHCAVALRYEKRRRGAPTVVAKGVDHVAARIREIAREHKVPIYEDPPLAWALYRAVEVGREIPADLYRAVAEVLAHVYKLRRRRARSAPEVTS